jgi:hypothetical protein
MIAIAAELEAKKDECEATKKDLAALEAELDEL